MNEFDNHRTVKPSRKRQKAKNKNSQRARLVARIIKYIKSFAIVFVIIVVSYLGVLSFPQPMFSNHMTYQNYEIWSDRTIPSQIKQVLDDATRRLHTSELYEPDHKMIIFFCNDSWKLWLYSQLFNDKVIGAADTWLTRYIKIRASDIAYNRVYSPGPNPISDAEQRPLSYFIAHEVTHIIESSQFGRLINLKYPTWLLEGYADYIGKGGDFDFEENRRLLKIDSPLLDPQKSGLYRVFHLEVAFLIDKKGLTVKQIFANPPQESELLTILRSDTLF
jgi:hypothetical protein